MSLVWLTLFVSLLLLISLGSCLAASVALLGWRRERIRTGLLTERIMVDGQIAALTAQTLAAMRHAARGNGQ